MTIFPHTQMGICPYCGRQYVESYSGNTLGDKFVDQHCFSCGNDFTVETYSSEGENQSSHDCGRNPDIHA